MPFDVFVNGCYQSRFSRYLPLCQTTTDNGYDCAVIVLFVGSQGSVHCRLVLSGVRLMGIPRSRAKCIAKYCSVSAVTGSWII